MIQTGAGSGGYTIDFAFRRGATQEAFVAELKCEIELINYRFLRLEESEQIQHHREKAAFQAFLNVAHSPSAQCVKIKRQDAAVAG